LWFGCVLTWSYTNGRDKILVSVNSDLVVYCLEAIPMVEIKFSECKLWFGCVLTWSYTNGRDKVLVNVNCDLVVYWLEATPMVEIRF
jgi:hypothetical protein